MTIVVGYSPDRASNDALELALQLARSGDETLHVVTVVPSTWPIGMARIDAEYRTDVHDQAQAAQDAARRAVGTDVAATYQVVDARSVPAGLIAVAEEQDARYVVVGSSTAGVFGHIALGSATDRLLHSSPVPVALAPRGYRAGAAERVTRITAAYGGSESADHLVLAAAEVAARVGATLRLASFAAHPPRPRTIAVGEDEASRALVDEWRAAVTAHSESVIAELERLPAPPDVAESVIGHGPTWREAIEDIPWTSGDVLVVGSSSVGPIARVFLGSRAAKIVRHAPVPVILAPRSSFEEDGVSAPGGR